MKDIQNNTALECLGTVSSKIILSTTDAFITGIKSIGYFLSTPKIIEAYSFFAWPVFCFLIILILKKDISKVLAEIGKRIEEINHKGVKFTTPKQENISLVTNTTTIENPINSAESNFPEIYNEYIDHWKNYINEKNEDFIILKFIDLSFQLGFEKTKQIIYKEQFKALIFLETCEDKKSDRAHIQIFYDNGANKNEFNKNQYSYPQWLSFLRESSLIKTNSSNIELTEVGVEFIRYIEKNYPQVITTINND